MLPHIPPFRLSSPNAGTRSPQLLLPPFILIYVHLPSSLLDLPLLYSPYNQPLSSSITFLPRIFSSAFQSRSSIPPSLHPPLPRISSPFPNRSSSTLPRPGASIFPPPSFVPGGELFFRGTPLQIYPHDTH